MTSLSRLHPALSTAFSLRNLFAANDRRILILFSRRGKAQLSHLLPFQQCCVCRHIYIQATERCSAKSHLDRRGTAERAEPNSWALPTLRQLLPFSSLLGRPFPTPRPPSPNPCALAGALGQPNHPAGHPFSRDTRAEVLLLKGWPAG